MRTLTEIRNDLAAKTKEIAPLAAKMLDGGIEGEERSRFDALRSDIETLKGEEQDLARTETQREEDRKAAREMEELARQFSEPNGRSLSGRATTPRAQAEHDGRSIGQRFVESDAFTRYRDQEVGRGGRSAPVDVGSMYPTLDQRALITSTTLDPIIQPQRLPGIMAGDLPELRMRDVFPNGRTGTNLVEYVLEGTRVNGAAEVAEATSLTGVGVTGGVKPESGFDLQEGSAPVRTIATIMYIPRNALADAAQMQSYIDQLLRRFVAEREDRQLLLGSGVNPNLTGINVVSGRQVLNGAYWAGAGKAGFGPADRIRHAITRVRLGGRGRASAIILNPERLESFELTKKSDTSNEYALPNGGPFGNATIPRIWGRPVIEHEDQPVDIATVVDGRAAMVFDRMDAQIYITDSNRDLFERNILTLLCESRLAFPIFFPSRIAETNLVATV